jgi:hypothetical protein
MKNKNVSRAITSAGEIKTKLSVYLEENQTKGYFFSFTESVNRGLSDSENGDVYTTSQLRAILKKSKL